MNYNRHGYLALVFGGMLLANCSALAAPEFRPGEVWQDVDGQPIQAHGGGILLHSNVYYWYGEDRTPGGRGSVACYSSTNLYDWKRAGVVLGREDLPQAEGRRTFVERPKVIFNPRTQKFVMWMHSEQSGYKYARAGIATSDCATGPFKFLQAIRPVANTNEFVSLTDDPDEQKKFGGTFRDMNLFVDDDGQAYAFYASDGNWTMYIVRLNQDFTGPELPAVENKTWAKNFVRKMREGPAPFKWRGKYYLISSACTGWKPNAADYGVADNILGPYESRGNPCVGDKLETTFDSQSTFVLPMPGQPDSFIFMGDRWNPSDLPDSRYVWLPFTVGTNGAFTISWRDRWDLLSGSTNPEVKVK
jgi:beta-xylosidase